MRVQRTGCDAELVAVRCLIVDDSEQFLAAAASTLGRDGLEVVGTATSSAEALDQVEPLRPDVVLVDVGLGEESGLELARQLVEGFPQLRSRVVLISTHDEDDLGELVEGSGAAGFICKSELTPGAVLGLVPREPS
jgi:DNA-binding NarL/FixJ family response regulator